jgi:hypothetical protein
MVEAMVLHYYKRIGAIGKNPVIDQNALDEVDLRSAIKGGFIGGGAVFAVGLIIWMSTNKT